MYTLLNELFALLPDPYHYEKVMFFAPQKNNMLTRELEDNKYIFRCELPGVSKENIETFIKDNVLYVKASKRSKNNLENVTKYNFSSIVPKNADLTSVRATNQDGILEIIINKAEEKDNSIKISIL